MSSKQLLRVYTYVIALLLYIPIAFMVISSFNSSPYIGVWEGFTTYWYQLLLRDSEAHIALVNSLTIAIVSSTLSVSTALLAALQVRGRRLTAVDALVYPPIVMPEVAEAVALFLAFTYLGVEKGWLTVMLGHTAFNLAFAYVTLTVSRVRFEELEDAARTLGAGRLQTFKDIILPLAMPGIVAALAITFLLSFTNFIKTLFTTGPGFYTLPILIWNRARRPGISEFASQNALNALATLVTLTALSIAVAYTAYMLRKAGR
ncbi:MAG: ABC transporter permease [Desulfurococcales archaeon]|jgi:spermidine/putrescine transport system permease protein|nr:ABC transporter permease [Desulfurococcales archaeon]